MCFTIFMAHSEARYRQTLHPYPSHQFWVSVPVSFKDEQNSFVRSSIIGTRNHCQEKVYAVYDHVRNLDDEDKYILKCTSL